MSLSLGIAFIGISVLSLRWLKHWYARREPAGGLADSLVVNFLLPTLAATLMSGAISIVLVFLNGITLIDTASAAFMFGLVIVAWRWLSRETPRDNVIPLTPKPGVNSAPTPTTIKVPRRAA